ncbi:GTPase domain-containing protein [Micromonospora sp. MS34]|uniref:GTPase domain-containing protein n=1 Tax=Micromonospora sp. MS34 TaxID=3385971 RepID=UPI0039A3DEC4
MSAPAAVLLMLAACLALTGYLLAAVTVAPLALFALLLGGLAGLVLGLVEATRVLGGLTDPPRVRTPRDEFTGEGGGRFGRYRQDYAWVHYAHRQAGYDLRQVVERCRDHVAGLWSRSWRALPRMRRYHLRLIDPDLDPDSPHATARSRTWTVILSWPLLTLPAAGLAGLTVGAVAALLLLSLVVVLVAVPAWLVAVAGTGLLRVADHRRQLRRGTEICCPRCYFLIDLPEYRCPGEHPQETPAGADRHRMLRPGLRGLWRRRCGCGTLLPVRAAAAGARLAAACPKCGTRLAAGSGRSTEVRVALFGAAGAGKTTLVEAMVTGLVARFPPDRRTVSRRTGGGDRLRPEVVTVTLRSHGADQRIQLFDAPGRGLDDPVVCRSYAYLHETRHFVFVLDAFSVVTSAGAGSAPPRSDPVDAYEVVVAGLRHRGMDTGRCRLAVVVTGADRLPLAARPERDHLRPWLDGQGLDQLVVAATRDFAEVGFFLAGRGDQDSAEPLRWLLRGDRLIRGEALRALR